MVDEVAMLEASRLKAMCRGGILAGMALCVASCSPVVRVEPPADPITINLNIKLDADVRLRVQEKAQEDVKSKPIF
jgi:hypothetical protein